MTYTKTPTITPTPTVTFTPVVYPYTMEIAVYNEAGELVKLITETTISNTLSDVVLTQSGTGVNAFSPSMGPLLINIPGVQTQGSNGSSIVDPGFDWFGTNNNGQTVANGTYYIRVTMTDSSGQASTITKSIEVISSEQYVQVNIYNSAGELVQRMQENTNVTFNAQLALQSNTVVFGKDGTNQFNISYGPTNADVFTWDGTNSSGRTVDSGVYTVQLVVKNTDGYTDVQSKQLTVLNSGVNGMLGEIKVIPNPCVVTDTNGAAMYITWSGTWQGSVKIKIYNIAAELIRSYEADSSQMKITWDLHTVSGQTVSSGIYIGVIEAKNNSGETETKIVKMAVLIKVGMQK